MRIPFIYTTHALHNPLVQALVLQGVEVRHITFGFPLKDLSACIGFYGNLFDEIKHWRRLAGLKKQLQAHDIPYVFWNRDAPWNTGMKLINRLAMQWLKPVDIYLAHSMQTQQLFGGEGHHFPNAARPEYYAETDLEALRDESAYLYDVSFFGSLGNAKDANAAIRKQFLEQLESLIKSMLPEVRFKVVDTSKQPLSIADQLSLIRVTKISLNYGAMCDLPGNPTWGLPERVFGIPAAGGLVLTDQRVSLRETFPESLCPSFSTVDECARQILSLLQSFVHLRDKADALHRHVCKEHTYSMRAKKLMHLLAAYKESRT